MARRLTGTVALLVVALLVADAYAYRGRAERCPHMSPREQADVYTHCGNYIMDQARQVLQMRGIDNPSGREGRFFDECCRELRDVDEQCRCDLLENIAREMQKHVQGQQGSQMIQKAKNLPSMCGIRQQQCDF